jgi:hypothetical protein
MPPHFIAKASGINRFRMSGEELGRTFLVGGFNAVKTTGRLSCGRVNQARQDG